MQERCCLRSCQVAGARQPLRLGGLHSPEFPSGVLSTGIHRPPRPASQRPSANKASAWPQQALRCLPRVGDADHSCPSGAGPPVQVHLPPRPSLRAWVITVQIQLTSQNTTWNKRITHTFQSRREGTVFLYRHVIKLHSAIKIQDFSDKLTVVPGTGGKESIK